jgi:microcystin-dependent protein
MGVTVYPEVGFFPGMVMPYAGPTAPDGWLLCDGSLQDRTTYAALYAVVGFSYSPTPGTDPGSNQFYLPNLKGKVIVMRDATQTEFDVLGDAGGSKTSTAAHTHSLSDHRHAIEGHTHTFTSDYRNTNHAHNVYSRDTNHDHAINHWHLASVGSTHWNGTQTHGHHDRPNVASEAPWEGANWAGGAPVNVDGTAQGAPNGNNISGSMRANWSHDHPSTNYASESPWPGDYNHRHQGTSDGTGAHAGWNPPNNNTSGASSAEAAAGNLQPYLTMNYLIKI